MRDASEEPNGIWRVAKRARNRAEGKTTQAIFPTLIQGAAEAHDPTSKVAMLRDTHFPPLIDADSRDLADFHYPQEVEMLSELIEMEVTQAILWTAKYKAPGPDGILNRVLHRVASVKPTLSRNIF